ncbi:site-specific DNA-methyltransferase, partial [bacterium]|nr:site-specific DNA-methyltransferase [bacterium]
GVALCHELIDGMYDSSFLVSKPGEKENRLWLDDCGVDMWPKELEQRKKYVNQSPVAEQNFHPTKKPIMLMSYLVRLLTTEGATVLDSFTGACTTGVAASLNNRNFIGVDLDARYLEIGKHRIQNAMDRRDNPQSNDYKYFSKFIDPSILTRQEKELREKIVNGTASIAERIIYRELISAEQIRVFKKLA